MAAKGPTYEFTTACWRCQRQKIRVVNEYKHDYGDEGDTTISGGLYCPRCDLAVCSDCLEARGRRMGCAVRYARDDCPIFPPD